MSTLTPRLQLKRPDGSDPFLRQDFVDNYNKLDAAPGVHVCTSTSRPNWGSAQAGRLIVETDTRTEYTWSGTAWLPILSATNGWLVGAYPNSTQSASTTVTHSLGTVTTTRPGTLMVSISSIQWCIDTTYQSVSTHVMIAGDAGGSTPHQGFTQWTGSNNNGSVNVYNTCVARGYKSVNPGTHTIALKVITGAGGGNLAVGTYRVSANVSLINEVSR